MKFDKLHNLLENVFKPISDEDKVARDEAWDKIEAEEMKRAFYIRTELQDSIFSVASVTFPEWMYTFEYPGLLQFHTRKR